MSFTSDIKNEISTLDYSTSEIMAELSAIINIGAFIEKEYFALYFENLSIARRIIKLLKNLYHIDISMEKNNINNLRKRNLITLIIKEKKDFILKDLSIIKEDNKRLFVPHEYIYESEENKIAYLRGAFIICGSINDPKTSRYMLEFMINNKETAFFINKLLNEFNFNSKFLKRYKKYMVYIKESESISDFVKMLNAYNSLFYYEDIRIYRDHKNMTNRLNNCEQANVDKIYKASLEQLELINKLKEIKDFDLIDEKLKEVCLYKEKYPESSMSELANIISLETGNKITKSGINHRFRKIKSIIENKINK